MRASGQTRIPWSNTMKVCITCGKEISTRDGDNYCGIAGCKSPPKKRKSNRKAMDDAMRSMGLVKVRGAMGGTYWE
jgi:hypothetical protein